ncbi:hypothetical protein, partial [Streptosporangium sp. NPDC048865]|uniref:hypothetical protein n=1 Tax=Streptosporangium sp. NPDC048865 TaxID=3155766 RepID=UPI0034320B2D
MVVPRTWVLARSLAVVQVEQRGPGPGCRRLHLDSMHSRCGMGLGSALPHGEDRQRTARTDEAGGGD